MADMEEGALEVCRRLRLNGYEAYLVGGCVRDMVLGRKPKDYDIGTSATPDDVRALFDRTVLVGEAFGVVRVRHAGHEYEVATFRTDGEYVDGRRPETVTFSTAEEDVKRRDFTINALLLDPETRRVIDHVGGLADIASRIVRAVGDPGSRFMEDRLRMLRAVRFSCQLGFEIERDTHGSIRGICGACGLEGVSRERVTEELVKIWRSPDPGEAWRTLLGTGLLFEAMPWIEGWRRGGAMDRLTLETDLDERKRETIAWAVALTEPSVKDVDQTMREHLRLPNSMMRSVVGLMGMVGLADPKWVLGPSGVEALSSADADLYLAWQRVSLGLPPHPAKDAALEVVRRLRDEPIRWDLVPGGHDLMRAGIPAGKHMGVCLTAAKEAVIERRVMTKNEAIEVARDAYLALEKEGKKDGDEGAS